VLKRGFSVGLFFASLAFLRLEIASTLNLAPAKALRLGMFAGMLNDLSAGLALLAIAALWRTVFGGSGRPIWTGLSAFLFVANLANTIYFRFFSTRLDWWVVVHHWRDLFTVSDSAGTLGVTPRVVLAVISFGASMVMLWRHAPPSYAWPIRPLLRGRLAGATIALEILLVAAAAQIKPIANKWDRTTSVILTDQILSVWVHTWFKIRTVEFEDNRFERRKALKEALPAAFSGGDNPAEVLAAFRDWPKPANSEKPSAISHQPGTDGSPPALALHSPSFISHPSSRLPGANAVRLVPTDPAWPLLSRVEIDKDDTQALRDHLGMPRDRPLNFMVFFDAAGRVVSWGEPLIAGLEYNRVGPFIIGLVSLGSVVAHTAVLLVFQMGQPRIFFSMSRDGLLPAYFARVHPRFKTPHVTTIWTGVFVALLSAFCNIDEMANLCNIGTLFAFVLVCGGVIILRFREPQRPRPFRAPFGIASPILGILFCLFLMHGLDRVTWWRFVIWLAIGLVIYALYGFRRSRIQKAKS